MRHAHESGRRLSPSERLRKRMLDSCHAIEALPPATLKLCEELAAHSAAQDAKICLLVQANGSLRAGVEQAKIRIQAARNTLGPTLHIILDEIEEDLRSEQSASAHCEDSEIDDEDFEENAEDEEEEEEEKVN